MPLVAPYKKIMRAKIENLDVIFSPHEYDRKPIEQGKPQVDYSAFLTPVKLGYGTITPPLIWQITTTLPTEPAWKLFGICKESHYLSYTGLRTQYAISLGDGVRLYHERGEAPTFPLAQLPGYSGFQEIPGGVLYYREFQVFGYMDDPIQVGYSQKERDSLWDCVVSFFEVRNA